MNPNPSDSENESEPKRGMFLTRQLPLETETCVFILINALDAFMTYTMLYFEGFREANSLPAYILEHYGHQGMIYFKFATVAFVTVISQIIATKNERSAKRLLNFGSLIVFAVVIYSAYLFIRFSGLF